MGRPAVFLLLFAIFAAGVAGCGGSTSTDPAAIVQSWSQAINGGDDEAAADLFADEVVVIQDGRRVTLAGHDEALSFNASLPCGGKIVKQTVEGDEVTTTFTLTRRPDHMCDGPGESAVATFRITDGKIVLWHQLPTTATPTESA